MSDRPKQVIVLRKDLNMRKGKMVAQGAHASIKAAWEAERKKGYADIYLEWFSELQTKICVGVDSEAELLATYEKAKELGLPCSLIRDAGLTEFNEPTLTAVAVGPAPESQVNKVTGTLKLL